MSARTFAEWQAYCSIEPFGAYADFWRAGMIACMVANVNRAKGQKPFKPEDFMPNGLSSQESVEMDNETEAAMIRQQFQNYASIQKRMIR